MADLLDTAPQQLERDLRDLSEPPRDGLAECMCLWECLCRPERVGRIDLDPMLTYPEHRAIWRTMLHTKARLPHAPAREFGLAWVEDLRAEYPDTWVNLVDLTICGERQTARMWAEYEDGHLDEPRISRYFHTFDWWLARLRRVTEARELIRAAQEMAERAWQAPERFYSSQQALVALERIARRFSRRPLTVWDVDDL